MIFLRSRSKCDAKKIWEIVRLGTARWNSDNAKHLEADFGELAVLEKGKQRRKKELLEERRKDFLWGRRNFSEKLRLRR